MFWKRSQGRRARGAAETGRSAIDAQWLSRAAGALQLAKPEPLRVREVSKKLALLARAESRSGEPVLVSLSPHTGLDAVLGALVLLAQEARAAGSGAADANAEARTPRDIAVLAADWRPACRRALAATRAGVRLRPRALFGAAPATAGPPAPLLFAPPEIGAQFADARARARFQEARRKLAELAARAGCGLRGSGGALEVVQAGSPIARLRAERARPVLELLERANTRFELGESGAAGEAQQRKAFERLEAQLRRGPRARGLLGRLSGARAELMAREALLKALTAHARLRDLRRWPAGGSCAALDAVALNARGEIVLVAACAQLGLLELADALQAASDIEPQLGVVLTGVQPPLKLDARPRLLLVAQKISESVRTALAQLDLPVTLFEGARKDGALREVRPLPLPTAQPRASAAARRDTRAATGTGANTANEEGADEAGAQRRGRRRGGRRRGGRRARAAGEGAAQDDATTRAGADDSSAHGRMSSADGSSVAHGRMSSADGSSVARGRTSAADRDAAMREGADDRDATARSADGSSGARGRMSSGDESSMARGRMSSADGSSVPHGEGASRAGDASQAFEEFSLFELDEDESETTARPRGRGRSRRGRGRGAGEAAAQADAAAAGDDDAPAAAEQKDDALQDAADDAATPEVETELDRLRRERSERRDAHAARADLDGEGEAAGEGGAPDEPEFKLPRGRAVILAHADRASLVAALLLAREVRQVAGIWVYPQDELMTFFRSVMVDLRESHPVYVVGFAAQPAREALQTAALYRGRLLWFDHHAWPPEDVGELERVLGAGYAHVHPNTHSTLPTVAAFCARRSRFSDKLVDLVTGQFSAHDFQKWGHLWWQRLGALCERRGDVLREVEPLLAGRPGELATQAARVSKPPLPDELAWVAAHDARLIHFGSMSLVLLEVPPELDVFLAARIARERYGAALSLARTAEGDVFLLGAGTGADTGSGSRAGRASLDAESMAAHLGEKFAWVDALPGGDHVARFRIRCGDAAHMEDCVEEVVAEIGMGRSILEG